MEKWIQIPLHLLTLNFSLLLQSVKGDTVTKDPYFDMNISADVKSNAMVTTDSSTDLPSTDASTFTSSTLRESSDHTSEHENNGMVVVYVVVPIAAIILALIALLAILIIRRRKAQHPGETMNVKSESHDSKMKGTGDFGVANEAFADQQQTRKQQNGNVPVPSYYAEVEDKGNIYYENDADHSKHSENLYYDYNNRDTRIKGIVEDEFGYGQFKTNANPLNELDETYQNTAEATVSEQLKELRKMSSEQIYTESESDSSHLYMNGAELSAASKQSTRKETTSRNISVDYEDPLYDHAKAGGHKWDGKEKDTCFYVNEENANKKRNDFQTVYMNDTNSNSEDTFVVSNDVENIDIDSNQDTGKTPVYLELEADEEEDKTNVYNQSKEAKKKLQMTNDLYDYASVNGITNDNFMVVDGVSAEGHEDRAEDNNYSRHYFILEKENNIQVEDNEYDSTNNHEYFILEKIERQ